MAVVREISAEGFRNLASGPWKPFAGRQLILGSNGAGKTSWLEAIYVLATTRSFRTHRLAICATHGREDFRLACEVTGDRRSRLEARWGSSRSGSGGLTRTVNDSSVTTAEYLSVLPVVSWSAQSGEVVAGAPTARRRFVDQGLVAGKPSLFVTLSRYRQALGQKRALLREGRVSELETWNLVLAPLIVEIVRERARHVAALDETIVRLLEQVSGEDYGIRLRYRPSLGLSEDATSDAALEELQRVSRSEIDRRMPMIGPQRDDLEILWRGHPAAQVTSAGERKLLGLALHAARGGLLATSDRSPIYLLDDLDTELDEARLGVVVRLFSSDSQLFVTSNRPHVWREIELDRIWSLEGLRVPRGVDREKAL